MTTPKILRKASVSWEDLVSITIERNLIETLKVLNEEGFFINSLSDYEILRLKKYIEYEFKNNLKMITIKI